MAHDAEVAARAAAEEAKVSPEQRKQQLDALLGGGIDRMKVLELKEMLEGKYKEVLSGKQPTMADVKKPALQERLREHVRSKLTK
eukprot:5838147-Prymnesium_polylepis.1